MKNSNSLSYILIGIALIFLGGILLYNLQDVPDLIIEKDSVITDVVINEPKSETTKKSESNIININQADVSQLMTLPGIGEKKALLIVEYRDTYGVFNTTEEIMEVKGIGESIYNKILPYITL